MKKKKGILILLITIFIILIGFTSAVILRASKINVPKFSGSAIIELNNNYPEFSVKDISFEPYAAYSPLDWLGRAGVATACLHRDLMPTETRKSIAEVHPTGWDNSSGIFHRSHLIGFQLAGDDSPENLITGTVFLNTEGMLPFENRVAMYVKNTNNHVLYRVTPLYNRNDLIPSAVQLEAFSLEDYGKGICINVLIYNVQPEYKINYLTGKVREDTSVIIDLFSQKSTRHNQIIDLENADSGLTYTISSEESPLPATYVLNTNTMKFHFPYCDSVADMKEKNRSDFFGTREEALALGYTPCGACCP